MSRSRLLYALLLLPAVVVYLSTGPTKRDPSSPLPLSIWVWSTGPRIDADAVRRAVAAGAEVPFVKAGTFDVVDGQLDFRAEISQGDLPDGSYRLVYSFTPAVVRSLELIGAAPLGAAIAEAYRADVASLGVAVRGLQVDLDCPTRLLRLYASALHALRAALPAGTELSMTTLLTWLDAGDFPHVLDEVDFHVPMAFGYRIPKEVEEDSSIADRDHVMAAVAAADRLGKPYWIGLGAYGYVLSFGPDGKLEHVHGKANPREVDGDSVGPSVEGRLPVLSPISLHGIEVPAGRTLVADRVRVATLQAWLAEIRREAGPRCRGAVLFRLAGKDDPLALTSVGFRTIATGAAPFAPELRTERAGWPIRVVLANAGPDDGGACRVTLRLARGRFVSAERGRFDTHEGLLGDRPASLPRSDRIVFTADGLGGEETIASGEIKIDIPFEGELTAEIDGPSGRVRLGPIAVRRGP